MNQLGFVYQLFAEFNCPLTGNGDVRRHITTVFTTPEKAKERIPKFEQMIRDQYKGVPIPDLRINVKPLEIIE